MAKYFKIILLTIVFVFAFLRLYSLTDSLFFINDGGRDMDVLFTWQQTGKLPLLGPQTSVFPINQSAIYFYILYPAYLLSSGSYLSPTYTAVFIYLLAFLCLYRYFPNKKILLSTIFLISIHPLFIDQTRQVWNPTLVPPFILVSLASLYLFNKKYSTKYLIISSLSLGLSLSLSYSVLPLIISLIILVFIYHKKYLLRFLLWLILGMFIFNLPTIIFEFRHNFLLTSSIFTKPILTQANLSTIQKLDSISYCLISSGQNYLNYVLFSIFIFANVFIFIKNINQNNFRFYLSFLNLSILIQLLILPVNIECHYLYPLIIISFITFSLLPRIPLLIILSLISFNYLQMARLSHYFNKASRTFNQLDGCFKTYCSNHTQELTASVISGYYPWHHGPEFRYLMKKNNCKINDSSKNMAVIVDKTEFTDKTDYPELQQFGKYSKVDSIKCLPNFEIITLEKI